MTCYNQSFAMANLHQGARVREGEDGYTTPKLEYLKMEYMSRRITFYGN